MPGADGVERITEVCGGGFALAFGGAEVEIVDAALVEGLAGGRENSDLWGDTCAGELGELLFGIEQSGGADVEQLFVFHDLSEFEGGLRVDEVESEVGGKGLGDRVDFWKEGIGGVAKGRAEDEDNGFLASGQ